MAATVAEAEAAAGVAAATLRSWRQTGRLSELCPEAYTRFLTGTLYEYSSDDALSPLRHQTLRPRDRRPHTSQALPGRGTSSSSNAGGLRAARGDGIGGGVGGGSLGGGDGDLDTTLGLLERLAGDVQGSRSPPISPPLSPEPASEDPSTLRRRSATAPSSSTARSPSGRARVEDGGGGGVADVHQFQMTGGLGFWGGGTSPMPTGLWDLHGMGDSHGEVDVSGVVYDRAGDTSRAVLHDTEAISLGDTNYGLDETALSMGLDGAMTFHLHGLLRQIIAQDVLGELALDTLSRTTGQLLRLGAVASGQHLSDAEVEALPKVRFEHAEEQCCAVCLERYQQRELLTELRCGHFFHTECLAGWFRRSTQCPLCRSAYDA